MAPNINRIIGQTFVGANIQADGGAFYDKCKFVQCTLIFTGTGPIQFNECVLDNCRWGFGGPAANTLSFLKMSYVNGNKEMVENVLREIRSDAPVPNPALKSGGLLQ